MTAFLFRMLGAAALDVTTFEEIEADRRATLQAVCVVILAGVATGVGVTGFGVGWTLVPAIVLVALIAWLAWALLTYHVGIRLATPETHSDLAELMRTLGFAAAPGLLCGVGVIPPFARPAFAVAAIWMLAAMIVAVRQALDYRSTARAVAVCVLGWTLAVTLVFVWGWMTPVLSGDHSRSPAASPDDRDEHGVPGVYRLVVVRDGRTTFASAMLIHRGAEPAAGELYLLTAASVFRDEYGQQRRNATAVKVELIPGEAVPVRDEDITLCPSALVDVALLKVSSASAAALPRLSGIAPPSGGEFSVIGFDEAGAAIRVRAQISRIATLLMVGRTARPVSDCRGAAVVGEAGVFGLATACDDRSLVHAVPLSGIASWLTRHVPGSLPLASPIR